MMIEVQFLPLFTLYVCVCVCVCVTSLPSKTALLEGLEVDQYMWGILNAIQK